jgi:hypothetical protein
MNMARVRRKNWGIRDRWLRGVVPLLDLFILLFAALLVVVADQHQQALEAMASQTRLVTVVADEAGMLTHEGHVIGMSELEDVLSRARSSGDMIVVVRDPHRSLKHGTMREVRTLATQRGLVTVYSPSEEFD